MKRQHTLLYVIEFFLIGGGFALLLILKLTFYNQIWMLGFILLSYIVIGIFHHGKHHDIHPKVVLEYILISALIVALFIFLNLSRL